MNVKRLLFKVSVRIGKWSCAFVTHMHMYAHTQHVMRLTLRNLDTAVFNYLTLLVCYSEVLTNTTKLFLECIHEVIGYVLLL